VSGLDDVIAFATDHGWTADERRSNLGPSWTFTHPDHPRIRLDAFTLSVRPYFHGRVLVDRRERSVLPNMGDLTAILADPTVVPID
jgi:hypothetical protein